MRDEISGSIGVQCAEFLAHQADDLAAVPPCLFYAKVMGAQAINPSFPQTPVIGLAATGDAPNVP